MVTIRPQHITLLEYDSFESLCTVLRSCRTILQWTNHSNRAGQTSKPGMKCVSARKKRWKWRLAFALDTSEFPTNDNQDDIDSGGPGRGSTRLGRIVSAGGRQLLQKLNSARKNFPMKIFLLLFGFYTANALATILGQTGDWDVLVAGVVVAAIEGIGMLMYRKLPSMATGRMQSFVVMINYWKAGVCLGLFVDAFKLGS